MLDIILLCRNRPKYAEEALGSLCAIHNKNFKITISDNSDYPLFKNRNFANEFPNIKINYIHRNPNLEASDHFTRVILESTNELLCLFHDDDIALPNFLDKRLEFLESEEIVAVGTNGYEYINQIKTKTALTPFAEIVKIKSTEQLLNHYFSLNFGKVAPFPGYIYKRSPLISSIGALKSSAKKYSDVILLAELLKHGTIIWDPNVSMYYRKHSNNDSNFEKIKDRLGLLGAIKSISKRNNKIVNHYRFFLYLKWLPKTLYYKNRIKSFNQYRTPIKKFLLSFLMKNLYSLLIKFLRKFK